MHPAQVDEKSVKAPPAPVSGAPDLTNPAPEGEAPRGAQAEVFDRIVRRTLRAVTKR